MFCPSCGKQIENVKFCPACGRRITQTFPQSAPITPVTHHAVVSPRDTYRKLAKSPALLFAILIFAISAVLSTVHNIDALTQLQLFDADLTRNLPDSVFYLLLGSVFLNVFSLFLPFILIYGLWRAYEETAGPKKTIETSGLSTINATIIIQSVLSIITYAIAIAIVFIALYLMVNTPRYESSGESTYIVTGIPAESINDFIGLILQLAVISFAYITIIGLYCISSCSAISKARDAFETNSICEKIPTVLMVLCFISFAGNIALMLFGEDISSASEFTKTIMKILEETSTPLVDASRILSAVSSLLFGIYIYQFNSTIDQMEVERTGI